MKITSDFALLDVKRGRHDLAKRFTGFDTASEEQRIPVTITGFISHRWGPDDGVSIEFGVDVKTVTLGSPQQEVSMAKAAKKATTRKAPAKAKPAAKATKKAAKKRAA